MYSVKSRFFFNYFLSYLMIGKQGEMVAKAVLREIFQNTRGVMYRHAQKVRAILGFKFCFQTQKHFSDYLL